MYKGEPSFFPLPIPGSGCSARGLRTSFTPLPHPHPRDGQQRAGAGDQLPYSRLPSGPRPPGRSEPLRSPLRTAGWLSSPPHPRGDATALHQWDAALRVCPPVENSKHSPQPLEELPAPAQPGLMVDLDPNCAALLRLRQQLCAQKSMRFVWCVSRVLCPATQGGWRDGGALPLVYVTNSGSHRFHLSYKSCL